MSYSSLIIENVKGITQGKCKPYFDSILKRLKALKIYNVHWDILNTADYGIPQSRKRLYIVGVPIRQNFEFPQKMILKTTFHVTFVLFSTP